MERLINAKFKKNQRVKVNDSTKDWDGEYVWIVKVDKTDDKTMWLYDIKTDNGEKWSYYENELER